MKLRQIIFTCLICWITAQFCFAQQPIKKSLKDLNISEEPTNCEMTTINIDRLWGLVKDTPNKNGFVIFIARLGAKENRRNLNQRRLLTFKKVLQTRYSNLKHQVIFAEGEKVKGYGRVEFYWNGELMGAIVMNKNRDACFSCCD